MGIVFLYLRHLNCTSEKTIYVQGMLDCLEYFLKIPFLLLKVTDVGDFVVNRSPAN